MERADHDRATGQASAIRIADAGGTADPDLPVEASPDSPSPQSQGVPQTTDSDLPVEAAQPGPTVAPGDQDPADRMMLDGWSLELKGDRAGALAQLDRAVESNPKSFAAHLYRGTVLMRLRRLDGALADFRAAVSLNGTSPWGYMGLAEVMAVSGRLEDALAAYGKAVAAQPDLDAIYVDRGDLYLRRGQRDAALADYQHALELNPRSAAALQGRANLRYVQGDLDAALADADAAIAADVDHAALAYIIRGSVLGRRGQYQQAFAAFDHAVKLEPNRPEAYAGRASADLMLKKRAAAAEDFDRALALDPANLWALSGLTQLDVQGQRFQQAVALYTRALDVQPNSADLLVGRAHAYYLWGKMAAARKDLDAAEAAAPGDAKVQQSVQALRRNISLSH